MDDGRSNYLRSGGGGEGILISVQAVAQFKALDRYPHNMHATMAPSLTLAPSDIHLTAKPGQISPPLGAEGQEADLTTLGHSLLRPNIAL